MKTNEKGQLIKYLVNDDGVTIIAEGTPAFADSEECSYLCSSREAIFETFEEAALFAIEAMSQRIIQLELKLGAKNE